MVHSQTKKAGLASLDRNLLCKRNSQSSDHKCWESGQVWVEVGVGMGTELGCSRHFLNIVSTLISDQRKTVFPLNFTVEKNFASFPQIRGLRCLTRLAHFNNISIQDHTHTHRGFPLLSTQCFLPTKNFSTSSLKCCR